MAEILMNPEQRLQLEALLRENLTESQQRRARLLLLLDDGVPTRQAAQAVGISAGRARHWRSKFQHLGMQIFPRGEHGTSAAAEAEVQEKVESPLEPDSALTATQSPPDTETPWQTLDEFLTAAADLKTPGVEPDDILPEAGRKVLRYHFAQMLLHEAGTRLGEDIEELHDMRVATRRMRAAFEVFEGAFTQKATKPLLKGLRNTGRKLGKVRDLDVFIEKAQHYRESLPEEKRAGLQPLLQSWDEQRQAAQLDLIAYLDDAKYARFKADFFAFVTTPGAGARTASGAGFAPNRVRDIAPVLIYTRLASVRAFDSILETASLEQFHALRIEFKKLRYTVEFFREVLGKEAKAVIDDLKGIQDHLGDLNDAQVATRILDDFLTEWDRQQNNLPVSQRQSPETVLTYMIYRYNERQRLMQSFRETWAYFNRPEFQQNLASAVATL